MDLPFVSTGLVNLRSLDLSDSDVSYLQSISGQHLISPKPGFVDAILSWMAVVSLKFYL